MKEADKKHLKSNNKAKKKPKLSGILSKAINKQDFSSQENAVSNVVGNYHKDIYDIICSLESVPIEWFEEYFIDRWDMVSGIIKFNHIQAKKVINERSNIGYFDFIINTIHENTE